MITKLLRHLDAETLGNAALFIVAMLWALFAS
jgi:hypothetical protein